MSKFSKKRGKSTPAISTASLPDIIFILLFFFMVVTVMRDAELKVSVSTPNATELTKLENKSLVNFLYIGKPLERFKTIYGTKPRLQLGDKISEIHDIPIFLEKHRIKVSENQRPGISSSLRVDGNVTMGIVQDVKTELRKSNQLKINYSAKPRARE
ncbi:MAG TPA: biopolymer transporter ExbD [Saprospiraceae bacterium]|nr:biopolymer transporter ExbD [Saprospiraceae bacterium]